MTSAGGADAEAKVSAAVEAFVSMLQLATSARCMVSDDDAGAAGVSTLDARPHQTATADFALSQLTVPDE